MEEQHQCIQLKILCFFVLDSDISIFFESCGIADLVATCHGGRNRLLGEAVVKSMKVIIIIIPIK